MRNLLILFIALLACSPGFAQRRITTSTQPINSFNPYSDLFSRTGPTLRTTAIGDTLAVRNIADTSVLVMHTATSGSNDSGYLTGTNYLLDQGFAEHYYVNGDDSSLMVLGVFAQFSGYVSDTSTQSVSFNIWDESPSVAINDTLSYNAFPQDALDTVSVPFAQLGLGNGTAPDTMKLYLFALPTPIWGSFFAGYTINGNYSFSSSNNIGLASTVDSVAGHDSYTLLTTQTYADTFYYAGDTTILSIDTFTYTTENIVRNVRNATMESDYSWYDNLTQNDSLRNHLAIYPIVAVLDPTGVKSVTKNNLTFYGNYPNPATSNTNIKFSLLKQDNVTIQIIDIRGQMISSIAQPGLDAGTHIVPVNTSLMPSGDYIYLIRTASGDGMAGKMTVMAH